MNTIHSSLCQSSTWYRKWHEHPSYGMYHWAVFLMFALFVSLSLINNINVAYGDNGVQNSAQAVASNNGNGGTNSSRPTWAGTPGGPAQDHILVKFKNSVSDDDKAAIMSKHGFSQKSEIKQIGVKVVSIPQDMTPEEAIQDLQANDSSSVAFAELDQSIPASFIPNDPYFTSEWHLPLISAPQAWDTQQGKTTITVAILDTGVDCTHPDLAAHCVSGWNTYDNNALTGDVFGHGTAVAGVAAAIGNNAVGVSGVAPQVSIMPVRISDAAGNGYLSTMASGLTWAADHGARVANLSYQVTGYATLDSAAQYFDSKGGVVTVAAGNYGTTDTTPADPYVITVSATNASNTITSWSDRGTDIDLAAPGDGIYTTTSGGGYASGTGTSFSAPVVAGVAALVLSQNPNLTGAQAVQILKSNADDLGAPGWDPLYGYGLVDANKSVLAAGAPVVDTTPPTIPGNLTGSAPSSSSVSLFWTSSTDNVGVIGYIVTRNGAVLTKIAGTSYSDNAVTAGTTYTYSVQAYDAAGNVSAPSNVVSVTVPQAGVAVTSFNVAGKTTTTATIVWSTNLPSTGTVIYGTSAGSLTSSVADTTASTQHTVTLTGLSRSSRYYYQIRTVSSDGLSTYNTAVSTFMTSKK